MRTHGRHGHMITAVVAPQFPWTQMKRHRHITLHASRRLPASGALQLRRIASAVLEEDDLFMVRQALPYMLHQRVGEMSVHLFSRILALEVYEPYLRQFHPSETLGE